MTLRYSLKLWIGGESWADVAKDLVAIVELVQEHDPMPPPNEAYSGLQSHVNLSTFGPSDVIKDDAE